MGTRALQVALAQRARTRADAEQTVASCVRAETEAAGALRSARERQLAAQRLRQAHRLPEGQLAPGALARYGIERRGLLAEEADAEAALAFAQRTLSDATHATEAAREALEVARRDEEVVARAIERAQAKDALVTRRKLDEGDD